LDENARLNAELKAAEQQLSALSAKLADSEGAEQAFQDARDRLKALVMNRREVLTEAADQVAGKSSELLKARLKKDPAPVEYCDGLNALMDRAAVHDASERCTAWIKRILHDDRTGLGIRFATPSLQSTARRLNQASLRSLTKNSRPCSRNF